MNLFLKVSCVYIMSSIFSNFKSFLVTSFSIGLRNTCQNCSMYNEWCSRMEELTFSRDHASYGWLYYLLYFFYLTVLSDMQKVKKLMKSSSLMNIIKMHPQIIITLCKFARNYPVRATYYTFPWKISFNPL